MHETADCSKYYISCLTPGSMTPNEVGRSIHLSRMTSSSRCLSSYSDRHASAPQQPSPFAVDLSRVLRLGRTAGQRTKRRSARDRVVAIGQMIGRATCLVANAAEKQPPLSISRTPSAGERSSASSLAPPRKSELSGSFEFDTPRTADRPPRRPSTNALAPPC